LTVLVASSHPPQKDQVVQILAARNYKVVSAPLGPDLGDLVESEPHDVAVLVLDGAPASLEAYQAYRARLAGRPQKIVVSAGVSAEASKEVFDAVKAAADAVKDRFVPGVLERDALLAAIELATRHLITILIADDEPLIRRMFQMFLTGRGFKVVAAEDGEDGIKKVREVLPDLVITDIKMPHKDGYDFCRAIKESRETQHIPVIIVSALGGELDFDRGFNAGANEYITKPVFMEDLLDRVQTIFRGIAMRGREKILIASGSQIERSMLEYGFVQQGFEVEAVRDLSEAVDAARRRPPSVVIGDLDPKTTSAALDIPAFCARLKSDKKTRDLPLVMLTGQSQKIDTSQRAKLDAAAYVAKPFSAERLVAQVERLLGERRLRLEVEQQAMLQAIMSIVTALEARDKYTRGHSENVARYSVMIARHVYETPEEVARLELSARLHDIGKIGVPDAVLLKPGRLTDEEMESMKSHPMKGVEILTPITSLADIIPGVRWHHERLDGKGYPDGLPADAIPLQARIISVGDTFDALTSHRPYRRGCTIEKAVKILREASGPQLDPALVELFIKEITERKLEIPVPVETA